MTCQMPPGWECRRGAHWVTVGEQLHHYEQCPEWAWRAKRRAALDEIIADPDALGIERSNARDELRDLERELRVLEGVDLPPDEPLVSKEQIQTTLKSFTLGSAEEEEKSQGFGMCVCGEDSIVMLQNQPLCQACLDKELKDLGERVKGIRG